MALCLLFVVCWVSSAGFVSASTCGRYVWSLVSASSSQVEAGSFVCSPLLEVLADGFASLKDFCQWLLACWLIFGWVAFGSAVGVVGFVVSGCYTTHLQFGCFWVSLCLVCCFCCRLIFGFATCCFPRGCKLFPLFFLLVLCFAC